LAEAVVDASGDRLPFAPLYPLCAPIETKLESIAHRIYGADAVTLAPAARARIETFERSGLSDLPICMAKTHLSIGHDPALGPTPTGFDLPIRDLRPYTGAGWIVALCGDVMTMPGLSSAPAALAIDIDEKGRTVGLR
jgi:formate--tetrahydrofolate ligase